MAAAAGRLIPHDNAATLVVRVPLTFRRRRGRKELITPSGLQLRASSHGEGESAVVRALAKAFRWRRQLEDGVYATVAELAAAEKINVSYVSRVLRLTLLAPKIVEAILDGRHLPELTIARLIRPFPVEWEGQRDRF